MRLCVYVYEIYLAKCTSNVFTHNGSAFTKRSAHYQMLFH